jgi:hypothetical protein
MTKTLVFGAAAALAALAVQDTSPPPADGMTLAVVRPDGIVVPFAAFDGGTWVNPWPEPGEDRPAGRSLGSPPEYWRQKREMPPATWHIWMPGAQAPVTAQVLTNVLFDAHCQSQLGMLTDAARSRNDPHEVALALDRALPVHQPINLRADSRQASEWEDLIAAALTVYRDHEEAALTDWVARGTGNASVAGLASRTRRPIALDALYAHRLGATRTMYFQGRRDFGMPIEDRENACNGVSHVTGWIRTADGQPPEVSDVSAVITDCDGMNTMTLRPLGIIEWRGEPLWLAVEHGWEVEVYSVLSVTPRVRRLLTTHGGGC